MDAGRVGLGGEKGKIPFFNMQYRSSFVPLKYCTRHLTSREGRRVIEADSLVFWKSATHSSTNSNG